MPRDPYRYFRIEARELVEALGQGALELEKGGAPKEVVARLLRVAHTLKGAARVVKLPAIAEDAHAIEDALVPYRAAESFVPRGVSTALFRRIDSIQLHLGAIDPAAPSTAVSVSASPAKEDAADVVRVEIREIDVVLEGISETLVQLHAFSKTRAGLAEAHELSSTLIERLAGKGDGTHGMAVAIGSAVERLQKEVAQALEHVTGELGQVRDAATRLRLVPAGSIFPSIELAAQDAARSLDRSVEVVAKGGEHRLDAQVLGLVRDALHHTVRNAVAHGIEPSLTRVAAGKPGVGKIEVNVERRGNRVAFVCADDGRGFDVPSLARAAAQRGLLASSDASSVSEEELFTLVLQGGLTTARSVNLVSGRAVGLDVVRETAKRLRGEVSLSTRAGRGARLELVVPVSLSSTAALVVQVGSTRAAVPLDSVRRTMRVTESEIAESAEGERVRDGRTAIPFLRLETLIGRDAPAAHGLRHWIVLVIEAGGAVVGVGVDRVVSSETVVLRPLPDCAEASAIVAGVSLDTAGQPQMLLDPTALVRAAEEATVGSRAAAPAPLAPILVIDDSLTTRMLEQSILESAGYQVELATSAEEALTKASLRTYCLFVVDVEMPGMSGFEFVARTRADAVLRRVPAILVTSRSSEADVQRGKEAGAVAYIVKGEFDQSYLLRTIKELVG